VKNRIRKITLVILLTSLIIPISITTANAKTPKKCGNVLKVSDSNNLPLNAVICSDGSPNLNYYKLLKSEMPKTMNLKSNASKPQILSALCSDWEKSDGAQLDRHAKYMFAWREWKIKGLSLSAIVNAYYGDWISYCEKGGN